MPGDSVDASLDKELSESVDRPLFQAEVRDKSDSGQGIKIDGSDSGRKNLGGSSLRKNGGLGETNNPLKFDLDGFFMDQGGDNFTTDQHAFLQDNLFTQDIESATDRKRQLDGLSFDEIKDKLERDFDLKTLRPKQGKVYLTMDSNVTTTDSTMLDRTDSSEINFDLEFNPLKRMANEFDLCTDYHMRDFDELLSSFPKEREARRASDRKDEEGQVNIDFGGFPESNFDFNFGNDQFQDIGKAYQIPTDQFIGDDKLNLELPSDATASQGGFTDRILDLIPRNAKKKGGKIFFSDVVTKLENERDPADLFYDLMCAARNGDILLCQGFPSGIDKNTGLPVIEITIT